MKAVVIGILALSILLNLLLFFGPREPKSESKTDVATLSQKYPLLSARILGEFDRDILIRFTELRMEVRKLVEDEYGRTFSVYFEYLPTGVSIGVNDRTEFFSASLLKVPTVMAYSHKQERKGSDGDPLVTVEQKHVDEHFGSLWQKVGSRIHISEAIRLALTESDNTALNVVREGLADEDYQYVYDGLDIAITIDKDTKQIIFTTKSYASVLKSLFFSSLLTKDDSHKILKLLTESNFKDKLVAGVPENIPIAHKISEYENLDIPIYADCGIVYVPRRQYILCMASKSDEQTAQDRMSRVSKMVYDFVSTTHR